MTGVEQTKANRTGLTQVLAHLAAGRCRDALALGARLAETAPDDAALCHALGLAHNGVGDRDSALACLQRACDLAPDDPTFRLNLAAVLESARRPADAARSYVEALRQNPDDPALYTRLGDALHQAGMSDRAVEMLQQALAHDPGHAAAHHALANIFAAASRLDEALHHREQAAKAEPGNADYAAALGDMLQRVGAADAARAAYDAAAATAPSDALKLRRALTLPVVAASAAEVERTRRRAEIEVAELRRRGPSIAEPAREVAKSYFQFGAQGVDDRPFLEDLAALYREACPSLAFQAPHCDPGAGPPRDKPRVGFVSQFFRDHTLGRLMGGVIERLSRDRFTVIVAGFGPPADPVAKRIAGSADEYRVLPRDLAAARAALADARLDLILYAGIGMDPLLYFLAFARLAPVQCTGWGFPITTGIATVDCFLSSALVETPEADAHYSESLIRLPSLGTRYDMPAIPAIDRIEAARALSFDANRHIYLYPYGPFRFPPEFDAIAARLLERDPMGELVMVEGPSRRHRALLEERLSRTVPDAAGRVRFLSRRPHRDFLALYPAAHVVLDPLVFSGGNTSFEAFATPVPVITLPGAFRRGRLTLGMYRRMGMTESIAGDAEDYVEKAVAIARDPDRRDAMIRTIRERRDALYADEIAVRDHEDAFARLLGIGDAQGS